MVSFPPWWKGGYPDAEKLLTDSLLQPQLPDTNVTYWLPSNALEQIQDGVAFLRVRRIGGRINTGEKRDEPVVQFAALTKSRDTSYELIEFVRSGVLESFMDAVAIVPGTPHKLGCEGEIVGPQSIPEPIRDERLVPATFVLHTWKPKGLPNYRQALGL